MWNVIPKSVDKPVKRCASCVGTRRIDSTVSDIFSSMCCRAHYRLRYSESPLSHYNDPQLQLHHGAAAACSRPKASFTLHAIPYTSATTTRRTAINESSIHQPGNKRRKASRIKIK